MTIYIANLNIDTREDDLTTLFSTYGKLTSVKLMKDPYSGVSKQFGFINMEDDASATRAIARLHNSKFMGKTIVVNKAKQRATDKKPDNGKRRNNSLDNGMNYNY